MGKGEAGKGGEPKAEVKAEVEAPQGEAPK